MKVNRKKEKIKKIQKFMSLNMMKIVMKIIKIIFKNNIYSSSKIICQKVWKKKLMRIIGIKFQILNNIKTKIIFIIISIAQIINLWEISRLNRRETCRNPKVQLLIKIVKYFKKQSMNGNISIDSCLIQIKMELAKCFFKIF